MFGNLSHHLTVDDIINSAKNIGPQLHDFFDHRMTNDDYNRLAQTLDDMLDFNSLSLEGILLDFEIDASPIPLVLLSPVLFWVIGLLTVGLLVVLFLLRKNSISDAILSVGIPVASAGLISSGVGALVGVSLVTADGEPSLFSRLLEDPVRLFTLLGLITAAAGVAIVIVSLVIKLLRPSPTAYF
jgi:hypothetical protein